MINTSSCDVGTQTLISPLREALGDEHLKHLFLCILISY